jgi:hypothetical protein
MKIPLRYQVSEYDCGPTTLTNALSYLYRREEIPPDVVKHIVLYCLDAYNCKGEMGGNGTSGMAMMFMANWLNEYGKARDFPIRCEFIKGPEVFICPDSRIVADLHEGGAAVVRVRYGCWHYVLLTGADEENVYLFDPYYRKKPFTYEGIEIIDDQPTRMNRKVPWRYFNTAKKGAYALGPLPEREATVIFKTDSGKA